MIRSRRLAVPVLALAAGLAVAIASGCSSHAAPNAAMPPPQVSVATVVTRPVQAWDDFTGRVAAMQSVDLRPRVSGYVERVAYREGQDVRKGDLLFVIDQRPYRAALDRALADLERARSGAKLAQSQDARARQLIEAQAISREEFDARHAATAQGNASVRAAEAAVASARLDLQFTEVRSPIDGRAGRALVTPGNLAQADQTLLTTVVSQDPMYVYFESDEQSFLRYAELARKGERDGTRNPVRVGLEVHVHRVERDDRREQGRVRLRQVADGDQCATGAAVDRGAHFGELEVEARSFDGRRGRAHRGVALGVRGAPGVEFLTRDRP